MRCPHVRVQVRDVAIRLSPVQADTQREPQEPKRRYVYLRPNARSHNNHAHEVARAGLWQRAAVLCRSISLDVPSAHIGRVCSEESHMEDSCEKSITQAVVESARSRAEPIEALAEAPTYGPELARISKSRLEHFLQNRDSYKHSKIAKTWAHLFLYSETLGEAKMTMGA